MFDDEDYELLSKYHWCISDTSNRSHRVAVGYLSSIKRAGQPLVLMHRLITDAPKGSVVDHINHVSTDNRKVNLRVCSQQSNSFNRVEWKPGAITSSRYKGVRNKGYEAGRKRKPWQAYIKHDYRQIFLGYYETEDEAAAAYNCKALELFGEYAFLNLTGGQMIEKHMGTGEA